MSVAAVMWAIARALASPAWKPSARLPPSSNSLRMARSNRAQASPTVGASTGVFAVQSVLANGTTVVGVAPISRIRRAYEESGSTPGLYTAASMISPVTTNASSSALASASLALSDSTRGFFILLRMASMIVMRL